MLGRLGRYEGVCAEVASESGFLKELEESAQAFGTGVEESDVFLFEPLIDPGADFFGCQWFAGDTGMGEDAGESEQDDLGNSDGLVAG